MSTPVIDYDALAQQHGGAQAVDYDALAAQHGATNAAAPDSRNFIQRGVDALTNVSPSQEQAPSWMTPRLAFMANKAQEFGAGAIQGATAPIVHPLQTVQGLWKLGTALAGNKDAADEIVNSVKEHPFQAVGNLVGGGVAGDVAGEAVAPISQAAGKVAGRALLLNRTPEAAYEGALKASTTAFTPAERTAMVQTALEKGIPISKGGAEKLADLIDDANQKRAAVIAADPTRSIPTASAVRNLDTVRARFANQVTPQPDMAEIDTVEQNFLNNPKVQPQGAGPGPASLPASEAQAMKSGTYRALGDKAYGEVKGASIEAQKALARGLKDEIATQFPELKNLNADESRMLDLQPVIERAVNRVSNHQAVGIGTPIVATALKAGTGSNILAVVGGALKGILDNPQVASRLAIAVSKGAKIPFSEAMARVQAYSGALESASGTPDQSATPAP